MRVWKILFLLVFVGVTISTVSAQKTWEKPFNKWSKDDTLKILNNSPWVESYQSTEGAAALASQQAQQDQADLRISSPQKITGSTQRTLTVPPVDVRLHSGLPVRQAIVRLQQIQAGYDKMDEKKRAIFDDAMKNILECPLCQKYYIVTMSKSVDSSGREVDEGLFQTMNNEQLKGNIWLVNDKGEKLELAQFIPPKGAKDLAIFFFPRDKNNSFITLQSKSFKVMFNGDFLTSSNPYTKFLPRSFEFKVSDLIMGDKVAF